MAEAEAVSIRYFLWLERSKNWRAPNSTMARNDGQANVGNLVVFMFFLLTCGAANH